MIGGQQRRYGIAACPVIMKRSTYPPSAIYLHAMNLDIKEVLARQAS
jgi:hypothetical protein